MKKIIHISDLHFGRENQQVVFALLDDIHQARPDVVVVSGDLTQRARHSQFQKAARFLQQIPFPKIVIPGNHDVPLYDVGRRFLAPFKRYVHYISDDFFPTYTTDEFIILGLNTAHSFTWKSGKITPTQLQIAETIFKQQTGKLKMLAIHHPFRELFFNQRYQTLLKKLQVDLIFSGHLHRASAQLFDHHVTMLNQNTLLIQAGTAVSIRLRGENNSYNEISVSANNELTVIIKHYDNRQFVEKNRSSFKKNNEKWELTSIT